METFGPHRIDPIVDVLWYIDGEPFHVRSEFRLSAHIEREVNAQTAGFRHGIDQSAERRTARQAEIVALGKPGLGDVLARQT